MILKSKATTIILLFIVFTMAAGFFWKKSVANKNDILGQYDKIIVEPTPDITVDKKTGLSTYISSKGKFTISYPEKYGIHVDFVRVQNSKRYHPVSNVVELDEPGSGRAPYVLIQYSQNQTEQTVDQYIANSSECEEVEKGTGQKIKIGGVEGKIYKNIHCSSKGETRIYAIKGNMQYNLIFAGSPVDEKFLMEFISRFKLN